MSRVDELAYLNGIAAHIGGRVDADGDGYRIVIRGVVAPSPVLTLAGAGVVLGGLWSISPNMDAAVAVAGARYGLSRAGNRDERRAAARRGGP